MAVYFDYPIQFPDDDTIPTVLSWHQNLPIVAVASVKQDTNNGIVSLHLDEGEKVDSSNLQKETLVSRLSWHPTRKVLAVAWNNGDLTLWNEYDKEAHEAPLFHKTTVTCMYWNGTGSRLISGDKGGVLCVWKVDQRGRFQQSPMFQHTLSSGISHVVFKLFVDADVAADIAAAAQAAVSGDESALDLFEWQKPGQTKFNISNIESIQMYLGCDDGNIYFLDERGKCNSCFQVEGGLKFMYYYEEKEIIVTINDSLVLMQHTVKDNAFTEVSKFKLSGQPSKLTATSAGSGLIATACHEHLVRVLDIENDQNFVLSLDSSQTFEKDEKVTCLSYNYKQAILAGGTNCGHVIMWQYNSLKSEEHPWQIQSVSELSGNITGLEWGVNRALLAANCGNTAVILNQSIMNFHLNEKIAAVQINHNQLSVETFPSCNIMNLKTDIHIKGVYCTKSHIVIWNGKKVAVYEISESKSLIRAVGTFNSDGQKIVLYEMSVYIIEPDKISVRTFQGTVKQELTFLEQEGDPKDLNICGTFMVVATTKSVLKIYDLSRREARQITKSKFLEDEIPNFGSIHSLKCNCNATRVAFISQSSNLSTSSFLYVWDAEADSIQCFNFSTGSGSGVLDGDLAATQQQLTSSIKGYIPKAMYWDFNEPKLLVCEATKDKKENKNFSAKNEDQLNSQCAVLIVTLFSTPDHGIIVQDHFHTDFSTSGLLGIDLPYYYFVKSMNSSSDVENAQVVRKSLRDFVGLEDADDSIKKAMSNFSYLSAIGNMDEAFKAIKAIKSLDFTELELDLLYIEEYGLLREEIEASGSVWENMARMCVKTKRLDVALVCLGNMGNACAAKAVRESQLQEAELDAHVAILAIQIGMYVEAEQLYKDCQRYDLLNQFYQASNSWKKAIDCAENHDRIHLRTTYYNYGKYLESVGNIDGAIKQYERSDTHHFEVPRMMFEDQEKLEEYIAGLQDKTLNQWWAQYLESIGEMESALRFYERSQDYLSMVRVHCYCGNMENAEEICNNSGDKAACYHLARQFDSNGDVKSAIHYFSRAQAYSNAIRLAKENEMDNELVNLSLLSTQEDMLDCARYFEDKESMEDKAIMLYHKGGRASKAIDLAFKTQQFGALQLISEDLDENADPEVLRRCAEFFIEHDQYDKAVNLLVTANRYEEAIQMCFDHHITLSEEMAERMSVAKEGHDSNTRAMILEKIAECALKQGSFHLATKKFTQAGNKVKAMKSLLKSGDTEKIVFFAGVSRQKEIYVMAANYLQSLDWRKDPEIMKNIIAFYTKGRALESLSSFYDACAQVEIDEFQDYEKAFRALSEAYKTLAKAKVKNPTQQEERLALIKTRLTVMKKFIQAKKDYASNPDESVKMYEVLLSDPNIEFSLQVGDVCAELVQHYVNIKDHHKAYEIVEDMRHRTPNSNIHKFIDRKVIEDVYKAVGVPLNKNFGTKGNVAGNYDDEGDEEEFLEEEIKEEEDSYVDEDDEYI